MCHRHSVYFTWRCLFLVTLNSNTKWYPTWLVCGTPTNTRVPFRLTSTPCAWFSRSWTKLKWTIICGHVPDRTTVTTGTWTIARPKYLTRRPWNVAATTSGRSLPFPWGRLRAWVVLVQMLSRVCNWSGFVVKQEVEELLEQFGYCIRLLAVLGLGVRS